MFGSCSNPALDTLVPNTWKGETEDVSSNCKENSERRELESTAVVLSGRYELKWPQESLGDIN